MPTNYLSTLLFCCLTLWLTACSNTKLRDQWQADEFEKSDFTQVLVVGDDANVSNRLIFEEAFSKVLKSHKIEAIQSNFVLGNSKPKHDKILAYAKEKNIKYILISRVADIELQEVYTPPTATIYTTGGYYYPSRFGYYDFWYGGSSTILTTQGYTETYKTAVLETTIYHSVDDHLMWAAKTSSFNAESISRVAEELATAVLHHMHHKKATSQTAPPPVDSNTSSNASPETTAQSNTEKANASTEKTEPSSQTPSVKADIDESTTVN